MDRNFTILTFIMVQQGIFAIAWIVIGCGLRLSRCASLYWALSTLVSGVGMILVSLRGIAADWISYPIAAWLLILGAVFMRRGIHVFTRKDEHDFEQILVLLFSGFALFEFHALGRDAVGVVLSYSATMAYVLLRSAYYLVQAIKPQYGRWKTIGISSPFWLLGFIYVIRTASGLVSPGWLHFTVQTNALINEGLILSILITNLVMHLSLAYLFVSQIMNELRYLSTHDSLTGLLNRRAMQEALETETRRMRRVSAPFALIMLDIDHFKKINDTFGHQGGDAALRDLSQLLKEESRDIDHIARIGGEEFCLILPNCDNQGALQVAERIRIKVSQLNVHHHKSKIFFTVSMGVTSVYLDTSTPEHIMGLADKALYHAKATGRNRVVYSSDLEVRRLAVA